MQVVCPYCSAKLEISRQVQHELELFGCETCLNPLLLDTLGGSVSAEFVKGFQDTRLVTGDDSIAGSLLSEVKASIDELPILPEMSLRIIALTNDEDSSMHDLAALVSEDPVVASRVIQIANSSYYRGLSEVTDITSACGRLGMRTVANTVQSVALNHVFRSPDARFNEMMAQLWRHSVAVAHLSSEIAILLSMPHSETVYLMGLMHDIGKIAMTQVVAKSRKKKTKTLRENEAVFHELLGRFHTLIGLHVALQWNIPADLAVGIFYHHDPDNAPSEIWRRFSHVVALADSIAHVTQFPSEHTLDISLITSPSSAFFSLSDVKLATLRVDLEDRMDSFMAAIA